MATTAAVTVDAEPLYETDFYAWTQQQGALLRARALGASNERPDYENLAEEIETLGRNLQREILDRAQILNMLLLRWRHQPELRGRGWSATILRQRQGIADLLDECPSLAGFALDAAGATYVDALADAELEAGPLGFPPVPPFTREQVLNRDFFPTDLD